MQRTTNNFISKWAKRMVVANWLGGRCSKCGESNLLVLEFHHTRDKLGSLLVGEGSIHSEKFRSELAKCVIFCRRCHQEDRFVKPTARSTLKEKLMELTGYSKCSACGYRGRNLASLEFHHRDKTQKLFSIGEACRGNGLLRPMSEVVEEVKKCDLLCSNCHMITKVDVARFETNFQKIRQKADSYSEWIVRNRVDDSRLAELAHNGKTVTEIATELGKNKSTVSSALTRLGFPSRRRVIEEYKIRCVVCGEEFSVFGKTERDARKCCSGKNCKNRMVGVHNRPAWDDLREMLKNLSVGQVAAKCGVNDSTVYRWLRDDRWFRTGP